MKVSVIVPLFNKAACVRRTLDSIAAQTFRDFEVIVVDDGSTDEGGDVATSYPDKRFRLVRQSNAGRGAALNRGIADARGEIIAFLEAGQEWLPEFLSENVRVLESPRAHVAAVVCGRAESTSDGSRARRWRRRAVKEWVFRATSATSPGDLARLLASMGPSLTVARKKVLWRHGGFFGRERCPEGEDAFLWIKVLLNEPVAFTLQPLVREQTGRGALARTYRLPRSLPPFLRYPEELHAACPRHLKELLRGVLSLYASKAAFALAYAGRWREGRELLAHFRRDLSVLHPWALAALLCATPVGASAIRIFRSMLARLGRRPAARSAPESPALPASTGAAATGGAHASAVSSAPKIGTVGELRTEHPL